MSQTYGSSRPRIGKSAGGSFKSPKMPGNLAGAVRSKGILRTPRLPTVRAKSPRTGLMNMRVK